ncbi:MAG: hypothetical protein NVS1B7_7350 [Candidatus Saccharimonadales bacterium]
MLKKLISGLTAQKQAQRKADLYRDLIRHEARIGGQLFGPIPSGVRREFFCLDENTWIWHEEWSDQAGKHVKTTRYDVRPDGILKSQNGHYQTVSHNEARHLYEAAKLYQQRTNAEIYQAVA